MPKSLVYNLENDKLDIVDDTDSYTLSLDEIKSDLISELSDIVSNYILDNYPNYKQNSDLQDKVYWSGQLLIINDTYTSSSIEESISLYVKQIIDEGKTLEEILSGFSDNEKTAWKELIKSGYRIHWIQECKNEFRRVLEIINSLTYETIQNFVLEGEISLPIMIKL